MNDDRTKKSDVGPKRFFERNSGGVVRVHPPEDPDVVRKHIGATVAVAVAAGSRRHGGDPDSRLGDDPVLVRLTVVDLPSQNDRGVRRVYGVPRKLPGVGTSRMFPGPR